MAVAVTIIIIVLAVYSVFITLKCENAICKYEMLLRYIFSFEERYFEKFQYFLKYEDLEKLEKND